MNETEQSALLDEVNSSSSQQGSVEQQRHEKVYYIFTRWSTHLNLALDHSSAETIVTINYEIKHHGFCLLNEFLC